MGVEGLGFEVRVSRGLDPELDLALKLGIRV